MEEFIEKWGYIAVFLGSLIEGESVILTAGFLSAQGYLSLPKIILVSFVGTLLADQSLFVVGYFYGDAFLRFFPRLQPTADRAFQFLHRYNTLYILSFRFIYGIRIMSPLIIGASKINFRRFAILNLISAAIWSVVSCSAGFLCGDILMHHLTAGQRFVALSVVAACFLLFIIWKGRHVLGLYKKPPSPS